MTDEQARTVATWRERLELGESLYRLDRRGFIRARASGSHGNTLRALVKYLDQVSDDRIPELEIPTGIPLVYELDSSLTPRTRYYLGDSPAAREAQSEFAGGER